MSAAEAFESLRERTTRTSRERALAQPPQPLKEQRPLGKFEPRSGFFALHL
jgi:hypothetical protein